MLVVKILPSVGCRNLQKIIWPNCGSCFSNFTTAAVSTEPEVVFDNGFESNGSNQQNLYDSDSIDDARPNKLRVLKEGQHNIRHKSIPAYAWKVLTGLRSAGFEAYLVGGSVRDLLLEATPKDFDVLSTARPQQVKKVFGRGAIIVGRRFPICHVRFQDSIVEVSSFSTEAREIGGRSKSSRRLENSQTPLEEGQPLKHAKSYVWSERDTARHRNSLKRDFTVNGLLFDPFSKTVYDYVGALSDLKLQKIRTIGCAKKSFDEDAARYLRAIRIAGRLGFSMDKNVSKLLETSAPVVAQVDKSRLMQELQSLMCYGAAEASLRLLYRYNLLDLLLPHQACCLKSINFGRRGRKSNFLFDLMGNLDLVTTPSNPCHPSLWVALLAFQLAVFKLNPSKVAMSTAALAVNDGLGAKAAAWKAHRIHARIQGLVGEPDAGASSASQVPPASQAEIRSTTEESQLLMEEARSQMVSLIDPAVNSRFVMELLGLSLRDAVAIQKPNAYKAFVVLSGVSGKKGGQEELERQLFVRGNNRGQREGRRDEFQHLGEKELKALCFSFSRIILNTVYPRAQTSKSK